MRCLVLATLAPLLYAASPQPVSELLRRAVQEKRIAGAVVVVQQHGKKIFEEAAGYADLEHRRRMKVDDVFMIASSTKPLAATTIMTLVDRGKLSLDDPISKYFPEFQGASTIRQALSHTSGMIGNDASDRLDPIRNFDRSLADAVNLLVRVPLAYQPGEKYSYGGASFCVAGRIAEMLTGMDFEAYLTQVLAKPLGMKDTVYRTGREDILKRVVTLYQKKGGEFRKMKAVMEPPDRSGPRESGFVLVPGGIYSTAADLIPFLQMHLNGGVYNGRQILSHSSVMEMRKKQTGKLAAEYGLGWTRSRMAPDGTALQFGHGGAYGTQLLVDTEQDLVAVILTQMPSAEAKPFNTEMTKAILGR
ncbi:MAG TPA: serine hydrolase domain-containing protein [Bryobacteraceae bacterium]|jgi:CubicO group peptidase (beta-lactamase class C family)|nr:serine hydrolase domain-containing protein [Bryobacteraceae bacterium]